MPTTVEVDVWGRWDALALLQRLIPYRSYLVQYGPDHWRVHAEAPGRHGEPLPDALGAIEQCLDDRRVRRASVRVDGRRCGRAERRRFVAPVGLATGTRS